MSATSFNACNIKKRSVIETNDLYIESKMKETSKAIFSLFCHRIPAAMRRDIDFYGNADHITENSDIY